MPDVGVEHLDVDGALALGIHLLEVIEQDRHVLPVHCQELHRVLERVVTHLALLVLGQVGLLEPPLQIILHLLEVVVVRIVFDHLPALLELLQQRLRIIDVRDRGAHDLPEPDEHVLGQVELDQLGGHLLELIAHQLVLLLLAVRHGQVGDRARDGRVPHAPDCKVGVGRPPALGAALVHEVVRDLEIARFAEVLVALIVGVVARELDVSDEVVLVHRRLHPHLDLVVHTDALLNHSEVRHTVRRQLRLGARKSLGLLGAHCELNLADGLDLAGLDLLVLLDRVHHGHALVVDRRLASQGVAPQVLELRRDLDILLLFHAENRADAKLADGGCGLLLLPPFRRFLCLLFFVLGLLFGFSRLAFSCTDLHVFPPLPKLELLVAKFVYQLVHPLFVRRRILELLHALLSLGHGLDHVIELHLALLQILQVLLQCDLLRVDIVLHLH
mmetsp:Transcript_63235/g.173792  ORF Transcript_63235/g.173792 Transcript_63235/m.173792 type:complete len:444 (+) Transcript_63235:656-1987(+)